MFNLHDCWADNIYVITKMSLNYVLYKTCLSGYSWLSRAVPRAIACTSPNILDKGTSYNLSRSIRSAEII